MSVDDRSIHPIEFEHGRHAFVSGEASDPSKDKAGYEVLVFDSEVLDDDPVRVSIFYERESDSARFGHYYTLDQTIAFAEALLGAACAVRDRINNNLKGDGDV